MFNKYCPKWLLLIWESKKYIAIDFINKKIDEAQPELAKLIREKLNLSEGSSNIMAKEIADFLKKYITRQI